MTVPLWGMEQANVSQVWPHYWSLVRVYTAIHLPTGDIRKQAVSSLTL